MGTTIRPELSEKNKYWIERHRFYELKHFCMQYPTWKKAYLALDGLGKHSTEVPIFTNTPSNPTLKCVEAREIFFDKIKLIEQIAMATDVTLHSYILKGVTEGISYDYLKARLNIPCSKDTYYEAYRRFFWLLHKARN